MRFKMSRMTLPPFERFYEQHREEIFGFLVRRLGPQRAEDAFQETFLRALRAYPKLRHGEHLRAWAYTIATRHLLRARAARAEARPTAVEDVIRAIDGGLALTQDRTALAEGEARVLARDVQRTCTQAMLLCLTREERIEILRGMLLTRAVETAWAGGPARVWLHTCTLDHPNALPNYVRRGFRPVRQEVYQVEGWGLR